MDGITVYVSLDKEDLEMLMEECKRRLFETKTFGEEKATLKKFVKLVDAYDELCEKAQKAAQTLAAETERTTRTTA